MLILSRINALYNPTPVRINPKHIISYEEEYKHGKKGTVITCRDGWRVLVAEKPEEIDQRLVP